MVKTQYCSKCMKYHDVDSDIGKKHLNRKEKPMKKIPEKLLKTYKVIRKEKEHNYDYILLKTSKNRYATVHRYRNSGYYMKRIDIIDEKLVLGLSRREFIDDHAIIHINQNKYVKLWQNKKFRKK